MTPRLRQYLVLERLMLELDAAGDPIADVLRDAMDPIWYALSDDERPDPRLDHGGMSTVILGRNRFVDCGSLLVHGGVPFLRVEVDPLRIERRTPEYLPSGRRVRVDPSGHAPEDHVRVVATPQSFAILWDDDALATATLLEPETVHLKLDLRPLGINIYDDPGGLHIGGNLCSGNVVSKAAAAISLGD